MKLVICTIKRGCKKEVKQYEINHSRSVKAKSKQLNVYVNNAKYIRDLLGPVKKKNEK